MTPSGGMPSLFIQTTCSQCGGPALITPGDEAHGNRLCGHCLK